MRRKLIALVFALVAFNLIFFSFNKTHLGQFLLLAPGTIGFWGAMIAFVAFEFLVFDLPKTKSAQKWVFSSVLITLLAATLPLFKASFIDRSLLALLAMGAGLISLCTLVAGSFGGWVEVVITPVRVLMNFLGNLTKSSSEFSEVLSSLNFTKPRIADGRKVLVWPLVFGVVLAVPLIIFLATLLSSADPFFAKFWKDLFNLDLKNFPWWVVWRVMHSTWFIIGALGLMFLRLKGKSRLTAPQLSGGSKAVSLSVVVVAVALLLGAFLVVQFPYLFARVPETELIKYGVKTYSEYVTRGFFELSLVSLIVYSLAIVGLIVSDAPEKKAQVLAKLNLVLLAEILLFIVSVLRRVYLYQVFHGLTRVRVYGSFFLILLIALTVVLLLRHIARKRKWFIAEMTLVAAFLFVAGTIGVDRLIATKIKPTVNGEVDYVYIARLSPDAYEGWLEAYSHSKGVVESIARKSSYAPEDARQIAYARDTLIFLWTRYVTLANFYDHLDWERQLDRPVDIQEVNLAEKTAYGNLSQKMTAKELYDLHEQARSLSERVINTVGGVQLDRSSSSPLVR